MANGKRRKWKKIVVVLVIAGGITGLSLYAFLRKKELVVGVQVEKVGRRNLTELVAATGRVQPVLQVKISPEVSGEIIELPVKEGQSIRKGELILKIKPDYYAASRNSAQASFKSALAGTSLAQANLEKARLELKRHQDLMKEKLVSESQFLEVKTAFDVATAQHENSTHQAEMARAALARAEEELSKTTIYSPITGTVSKLNSQVGERVVGTATMAGTEVMTLADLDDMEARVDIGEVDVVLIARGQKARLELDAYGERKFRGIVTEIANTARSSGAGTQQEATKFEVKIRIVDKVVFRPGMSVTAEVETRSRTNVLCVPIQSVTTRLPGGAPTAPAAGVQTEETAPGTAAGAPRKTGESLKPLEVVFLVDNGAAKMTRVKRGISDDTFVEIVEGLKEGEAVVSGGFLAINRDLADGLKVRLESPKVVTAPGAEKTL